jgi:hypothetical protein
MLVAFLLHWKWRNHPRPPCWLLGADHVWAGAEPLLIEIFPAKDHRILGQFTNAKTFVWCQEESQNMGAWNFIAWQLRRLLETSVWYAGRAASASPAVGSLGVHKREQKLLIQDAFTLG